LAETEPAARFRVSWIPLQDGVANEEVEALEAALSESPWRLHYVQFLWADATHHPGLEAARAAAVQVAEAQLVGEDRAGAHGSRKSAWSGSGT
jgi:hypothetical protein